MSAATERMFARRRGVSHNAGVDPLIEKRRRPFAGRVRSLRVAMISLETMLKEQLCRKLSILFVIAVFVVGCTPTSRDQPEIPFYLEEVIQALENDPDVKKYSYNNFKWFYKDGHGYIYYDYFKIISRDKDVNAPVDKCLNLIVNRLMRAFEFDGGLILQSYGRLTDQNIYVHHLYTFSVDMYDKMPYRLNLIVYGESGCLLIGGSMPFSQEYIQKVEKAIFK
ncbi:MAG: hypothetical protein D6735_09220 [Acidobacteria bacterium]|nr:MAG: hypothetical protein D6735_09220 [Acidobacteriota bacterium]